MQKKKWKKFNELTSKCYSHMAGFEKDSSCWFQAFELLKELIIEERSNHPDFAPELELLDEATDYRYDICGWLEDCLDEIDMQEEQELLLKMCDDLLGLFSWPDYSGSDLKFRKSCALRALGRKEESTEYCLAWLKAEPENISAATASVYSLIAVQNFDTADKLVHQFIPHPSKCTDDNDIMFLAASRLYEATGRKKEKKQIDKAIQEYDEYLQCYFEGSPLSDGEEDILDFSDLELPFL